MSLGRDLPGSASAARNKRIPGHAKGGSGPREGGFPVRAERICLERAEAGFSTDPLKRTPGVGGQEELN